MFFSQSYFLVLPMGALTVDSFFDITVMSLYLSDLLPTYDEYYSYPRYSGSSIIADDIYFIPAMVSTHLFFLLTVRRPVVT